MERYHGGLITRRTDVRIVSPQQTGPPAQHLGNGGPLFVPNTDPEKRRATDRRWREQNPARWRELSKLAMRRWRERHPELNRLRYREYWARHPEKRKASWEEYRRRHPETHRSVLQRRRARLLAAPGNYTVRDWRQLLAEYDGRCGYCGSEGDLQPDHRVPLSRGGSNFLSNLIPACPPCNRRKSTMTEEEFRTKLARDPRYSAWPRSKDTPPPPSTRHPDEAF